MATDIEVIESSQLPEALSVTSADRVLIIQNRDVKQGSVELLRGPKGEPIELSVNSSSILWRYQGATTWQNLIALSELKGKEGEKPIFRKTETGIEYKYETEPNTAYRILFTIDELRLKFSDLTPSQIDSLKLKFADLTESEVNALKQPATDAAALANESISNMLREWGSLKIETNDAILAAQNASKNVKDGKTVQFEDGVTAQVSNEQPARVYLIDSGRVDSKGNPIMTVNADIPQGRTGKSFIILAHFDSYELLVAAYPDGSGLDGFFSIGIEPPFNYYTWGYNATTGQSGYLDQGQLQGPSGDPGKSAYQIAVDNGFEGTIQEWLKSIEGKSWKVIDIVHVPGENDLTYEEEGKTIPFPIGSEVRFYDPEKQDYLFYKLYNISADNKAEWKIAGTGSGGGDLAARSFDLTLLKDNWTFNGESYSYQVNNIFVQDGTYISVVIQNNSVKTVQRAKVYPQIAAESGKFYILSKNIPDQNIDIKYSLIGNGSSEGVVQYEPVPDGGLIIVNGNQFAIDPDYRRVKHKSVLLEPSDWTQEGEDGLWMARIPAQGMDEDLKNDCLVLCGSDDSTLSVWEEARGITSIVDVDSGFFYAKCKNQPMGSILYKYTISI